MQANSFRKIDPVLILFFMQLLNIVKANYVRLKCEKVVRLDVGQLLQLVMQPTTLSLGRQKMQVL